MQSKDPNASLRVRANTRTFGANKAQAARTERLLSQSSGNKEGVGLNHLNRNGILQLGTQLYSATNYRVEKALSITSREEHFQPVNRIMMRLCRQESWQGREVLTNHDRSS
jgi:hypothetical protein